MHKIKYDKIKWKPYTRLIKLKIFRFYVLQTHKFVSIIKKNQNQFVYKVIVTPKDFYVQNVSTLISTIK